MSNEKDSTIDSGQTGCLLALDTSTATLSLAWLENGELKAEMELEGERNHSVLAVPALKQLAEKVGRGLEHVEAVAVGHGPGSYTGVRIGVTVAKTLAWALQIPLIGVSSLKALACAAAEEGDALSDEGPKRQRRLSRRRLYVPLMDARRGQAYTAIYEGSQHRLTTMREDGIMLLEDLLDQLRELGKGQGDTAVVFTGDTAPFAPQLQAFAEDAVGDGLKVDILPLRMKAACIGKLARLEGAWMEGEELHPFAPNYTQLAEAEAKLLARKAAEAREKQSVRDASDSDAAGADQPVRDSSGVNPSPRDASDAEANRG